MLLTVMLLPMIVMVMITWVNLLDFSSIAKAFALRWSLVIDDYDVAVVAVVEVNNEYNVGGCTLLCLDAAGLAVLGFVRLSNCEKYLLPVISGIKAA